MYRFARTNSLFSSVLVMQGWPRHAVATDFTMRATRARQRSVLHCRCATGHEPGAICAPDSGRPRFRPTCCFYCDALVVRYRRTLPLCALFDAKWKMASKRFASPATDLRPAGRFPSQRRGNTEISPVRHGGRPGTVLVAYSGMKPKKNPEFTTLPRNMIALANPLASSHATAHAGHGLL